VPGLAHSVEIGFASGLRSMAAPSQLSKHLAHSQSELLEGAATRFLAQPIVSSTLRVAAIGEMIADKLPGVPNRIEPGPLVGRAVIGAATGGMLAKLNQSSLLAGSLLGALGAGLGAYVGYYARRALTSEVGLPDLAVAVVEDVLAITVARHALRA
jgi:uncharacterized membrane protein